MVLALLSKSSPPKKIIKKVFFFSQWCWRFVKRFFPAEHRGAPSRIPWSAPAGRGTLSASPDNKKNIWSLEKCGNTEKKKRETTLLESSVGDPDPDFWGLLDSNPGPLVRGTDPEPDPSIIKQKW
jgi:hypothetical protein